MTLRPYNAAAGVRVKKRRLALGLSLEDVAKHLRRNRSMILRYESGEVGIDVDTLVAFARCLRCKPCYFLKGIEDVRV